MRKYLVICSLLMTAMILLPLTALDKQNKTVIVSEKTDLNSPDGVISVMKSDSGKVEKTNIKEYIVGALAAEMSMDCHDEALKAQAVACFTYAMYIKANGGKDGLNGADISDDSQKHQGYINKDARKKKWGDKFDEYEKKAQKIADSVEGKLITYDGKPILAAYHELCGGKTESAKTVWGEDIPYLQSVLSVGDKLAPGYNEVKKLTAAQFESTVQIIDGISLDGDPADWISELKRTDSGFVTSLEIGGAKVSPDDFKKAFELRSRNFNIEYSDEKFLINTVGNGHMVGMSQYGADYMARQGSDWQEIIKHYYTGVAIE